MGSGGMLTAMVWCGFWYNVVTNTVYCPFSVRLPRVCGTITGIGYRAENGPTEVLTSAGDSGVAQWLDP